MWKTRRRHVVFQRWRREESYNGIRMDFEGMQILICQFFQRVGQGSWELWWKNCKLVKEIVDDDGKNDKCTGQMKENSWSWHCKIPLFTYPWVQGMGTQMMKCLVLPVIWWCNELKLSIGKLWYPLVVMNLMRLMGLLIEGSPNSKKKGLTQLLLTFLTRIRS